MSTLGMAPAQHAGTDAVSVPQRNGFLLVVSGPSGAGKGTLVSHLIEQRPDCVFSVSATTRARRSTEVDGREYQFLSKEEFERRRDAGYFLETAEVHGNLYGTPIEQVDSQVRAGRVVVLDVDVQGGASVRRVRPDAVSVFVYPPSLDSLRARLESRATDSPEVIERRIANAPSELAQWVHYDYVIMNDRLEQAQNALLAIHDAEHARVHRLRIS
jgi:guanylate kinase